jgi:CBS domain containing-hemolysin-like protein
MEDLPLTFRLIVLFLLLGVNSFFAAAEVALVSVRQTRMRQLAEAGNRAARFVLDLLARPDRMLSATQLGVTLASLGLGWAGEETVYRLIEPLLGPVITPDNQALFHLLAFVLSFTIITFLHMVVGEVVPKNLGLERAERLSLAVAPQLLLFMRLTGLFVSLVEGTAYRISRMLGLKMDAGQQGYTAEELKLVVSVGKREDEQALRQEGVLHRVIDFYDLTVREVMVPRQEMVALPLDATFDTVLETIIRQRHSRVPIYEVSPEHVIGFIHSKDIWAYVEQSRRWQMLDRPPPPFLLRSFIRNVVFVPETKALHDLLHEFQERRFHMAMVVDEFGTVVGLATVEDALEQIVGEIRDEHERLKPGVALSAGEVLELDGITNIIDLESQYQIKLPYDAGFETLAGFLLSRLGNIPEGGEQVEYEGRRYTVLEMRFNRISRVRIEPAPTEEESIQEAAAE